MSAALLLSHDPSLSLGLWAKGSGTLRGDLKIFWNTLDEFCSFSGCIVLAFFFFLLNNQASCRPWLPSAFLCTMWHDLLKMSEAADAFLLRT